MNGDKPVSIGADDAVWPYLYGTRDKTEMAARGYLVGTREDFETNMRGIGSDVRLLETLLRLVRMEHVLDSDKEAAAEYQIRLGIAQLEVINRMASGRT